MRDRGAFVRLTGVLFLVYLATGLWSPLLAVYIGALGAGTAQIGLVLATYQASSLASQYWWGRFSDRLGRRRPLLLLGTAGLSVAYLGIAGADHYSWLFIIRAIEGVALAAYSIGSLALIGDLLEDQTRRGRLMGIYRTFGSLAFAVAALTGGWLADTLGQRVPLLAAAGCYALACLLSASIRERPADAPREPQAMALAAPADLGATLPADSRARRALWSFLGLLFAWMFSTSAVVSLWPVFMKSIGYSQTAVGGLWALAALGEAPCMILAGHLSDRWGRKPVMLTGFVGMSIVFLAYSLAPTLAWIVGVQLLRSMAYASFESTALLYATELGLRRQRGRLVGMYYSAGGLGGIAGSAVGGAVAQLAGMAPMFMGVVVFMVVTAAIVGKTMPRLRSLAPESAGAPLVIPNVKRKT
ncbi:MAG: MFS transporter [Roseiflexaceae bacterium]